MKIRQTFGGRGAPAATALALFVCMSVTMLFAQAPSAPTHLRVTAVQFPEANVHANTRLTYSIIDAPAYTYGYDVFQDGRLLIRQTSVPALPGNEGFKTKEDATKIALLVIEKIGKGEMPPTISVDEMTKLGVVNHSIQQPRN